MDDYEGRSPGQPFLRGSGGQRIPLSFNSEWEVAAAQMAKRHGFSARTDYHKDYEKKAEAARLARDILRLSRNTLLINLRFMESALVRLTPEEGHDDTLTSDMATDGNFLYYNSLHVCRSFKRNRGLPPRDRLHVTLHCVFQHLFVGKKVNADLWDLACDIAVEAVIDELNIKALYCERQEKQGWLITKLQEEGLPRPTAERVYHWLLEQSLPPQEIGRLRGYFYADDHKIWHNAPVKAQEQGGEQRDDRSGQEDDAQKDDSAAQEPVETPNIQDEEAQESPDASGGRDTGERRKKENDEGTGKAGQREEPFGDKHAVTPQETRQMWKDISERIQVDLDTTSSTWGEQAGGFVAALKEVNRERVDYAAFLRRFAVLGENIQVNDDEFDYIFYTYGMKLSGQLSARDSNMMMPLIEPLEYKEVKKVREFVIALDTSESVAGGLVQTFVTKTWNLLKQTENFFTKVNVHIIQCGAKVEEDAKITSQDEFDHYMRSMVLRGFGGTDFRPVFDYVDRLLARHEFMNLRGLLYFTDGYGTFPAMPPQYETAFVFVEQGRELPDVPVWATKILMTKDEIDEL